MKHFFANPDLGLIGLLFFFIFFCSVLVWTFRPSAKKSYEQHAQIPLDDEKSEMK